MTSRWPVALGMVGTAVLTLALGLPPADSTTPATARAASLPCNAKAPTKANGTKWKCVFYDGFNGQELNRRKWGVIETSSTAYHGGPECFVDRPGVIKVSHGALRLSVVKAAKPFTCRSNNRATDFTAIATAGSIDTLGTFTRTYGRFVVRAAFPGTKVPGLHSSIWMFPEKLSAVPGGGTDYGEIDTAEFYTSHPNTPIPTLHYTQTPSPSQRTTNSSCRVAHPGAFHTYTLQWSRSAISIWYDHKLCLRNTNWSPAAPLVHPAPFDKPFGLILTEGLGTQGKFMKRPKPPPAVMRVDWVRVWG